MNRARAIRVAIAALNEQMRRYAFDASLARTGADTPESRNALVHYAEAQEAALLLADELSPPVPVVVWAGKPGRMGPYLVTYVAPKEQD